MQPAAREGFFAHGSAPRRHTVRRASGDHDGGFPGRRRPLHGCGPRARACGTRGHPGHPRAVRAAGGGLGRGLPRTAVRPAGRAGVRAGPRTASQRHRPRQVAAGRPDGTDAGRADRPTTCWPPPASDACCSRPRSRPSATPSPRGCPCRASGSTSNPWPPPASSRRRCWAAAPGGRSATDSPGTASRRPSSRSSPRCCRRCGPGWGCPPCRGGAAAGSGRRGWPVLHGFSPLVVPRPRDWRAELDVTGYWWPHDRDTRLPPPLREFLDAGPPPVFVGLGSATVPDPASARAPRSSGRCVGRGCAG